MLKGQWEILDSHHVAGWVLDADRLDAAVSVRVTINDVELPPVPAAVRRPDLEARFGSGNHGFNVDIVAALRPGFNAVSVVVDGADFQFELPNRDLFHTPGGGAFGERFRADPQLFLYESQFKREIEKDIPLRSPQGTKLLAEAVAETKVVFVLFTNRSGSNLITEMLKTLGLGGGVTHEPFLADVVRSQVAKHGYTSVEHYLASTIRTYRRNGTVFLKIGWDALAFLTKTGVFSDWLQRSHFIWTRRHDKIMQAISYVKALRTGVFFERDVDAPSSPRSFKSLWQGEETLWAIANMHRHLHEADTRLSFFLEIMNVSALEVWYENIDTDMTGTFDRVRAYVEMEIGVDVAANVRFEPQLRKHESVDSGKIKQLYLQMIKLPKNNININDI